jgi:hypothetical protein
MEEQLGELVGFLVNSKPEVGSCVGAVQCTPQHQARPI